jgi:polyhydroxyalkanoate synthesis regulator phasin
VTEPRNVFDRLRARGEEVLSQVSAELMNNPQFAKAMGAAMRGKEKLDDAVGRALKTMNVPTRSEFKRAVSRIEALEAEVVALRAARSARKKNVSGGTARARKKKTTGRSTGKKKASGSSAS